MNNRTPKIAFHPYRLKALSPLNLLSTNREREGALIRVTFDTDTVGFADVHPWLELGDLPLHEQIKKLKAGILTSLTKQSLYFAKLDAEARREGVNLFEGLTIPKSHCLLTNENSLEPALEAGFTHFKVKIKALIQKIPKNIRIDFNCTLAPKSFRAYLADLPLSRIDFIEDPYPFEEAKWAKEKVPLACDACSERAIGTKYALVIKPAVQDISPFLGCAQRLIITSYMDHPLGQMTAAYSAAKYADQVDVCGLLTHHVYEKNPFSEQLQTKGPQLLPPEGTGFGFDKELQKLSWK